MRQRWRQETSGAGAASLTSSNSSQGQKVDIWRLEVTVMGEYSVKFCVNFGPEIFGLADL